MHGHEDPWAAVANLALALLWGTIILCCFLTVGMGIIEKVAEALP